MSIDKLDDLELLRETVDFECKLAAGRDGQGAVPEDFWRTYSAFANTHGGVIILGLREKQGHFVPEGIADIDKVRRDLFNIANNRQKISTNVLTDQSVREVELEGRKLLRVEVARATRQQRPVHLTLNPFGNSYRRLHDGDRCMSDEEVRRMLAEQVEDSRDERILPDFGWDDLCLESFHAYRQAFASRDPTHPWVTVNDTEFLRQIGAWRRDRSAGVEGLTLAGLLMFGWQASIHEVLPHYMLDFQDRPEAKTELRWKDRLTLDGRWSGNLYDFYRRVYAKLIADMNVPFALEGAQRRDETTAHVALREALANALVHADYTDRASVLVVKRPDMFGFRNPGLMRIPPELAIQGGESDGRNRILHKMFRFVGLGEQAGSGVPKIYSGWADHHWRAPALYEKQQPFDQTLLELRMVDLLPAQVLHALHLQFGQAFDALEPKQRVVLAVAATEKTLSHNRVMEVTGLQALEGSRLLQTLVRAAFLEIHNPGRAAVYCLSGTQLPTPEDVFGADSERLAGHSEHLAGRSEHLAGRSEHLAGRSEHLNPSGENVTTLSGGSRDARGQWQAAQLDAPIVYSLQHLAPEFLTQLQQLAALAREKRKLPQQEMRSLLMRLCSQRYITLECLAELLDRSPDALRQQHLKPLLTEKLMKLAFPSVPNHSKQAYRSVEDESQT